jgi:DNA-binding MarR family transcriptional regulator
VGQVKDAEFDRLSDLAELIVGVARHLRPPPELDAVMCTPMESAVMRFISRNPGTSPRAASEATLLPSSNFSRVLRELVKKGLVRREIDSQDARTGHLYPTARAQKNLQKLQAAWRRTLRGTVDDPKTIDFLNSTLQRIEIELVTRRRRAAGQ